MARTGTETFLFTDIEASTRRWAENPAMADVLATHDELLRAAIESAGGRWVKHTGDGVFAVFPQASRAVEAAVDIQRSMRRTFVDDPRMVRIGLHTGEAEQRGEDVFGLAVSMAARIMDAAHGGQVLVSAATKAVLVPDGPFDLIDLGPHRLKDMGDALHLFQVSAPDLEHDFPPPRTLESVDHNFPLQLSTFIGRERELADIVALIAEHRLVTLTGVGGAGKTRLALQAASELVDRFRDGARFVELAPVNDPAAVPVAIASVLGVRHEKGAAAGVVDRLLDHLRGMELLLVIDNCEHILSAVATIVEQILSIAPGVSIVATSREGLGVRGEWIWQVPSLTVTADGLESDAIRLFMERASAVGQRFEMTEETRSHVVRICELLDGIPLAIELAAARTRVLSPEQLAGRLSDRFRLLTGGVRSALPRQQTLEAAIDWSYQLLSDPERRLFERLAVFVGGFTLEAVEAVCTDEEVVDLDVLDLLTTLVDKSMAVAELGPAGVSRYRLLETLRHFGLRRLVERGEVETWKRRHLAHFSHRLAAFEVLGWNPSANVPWYAAEHGNLSAAFEWAPSESAESVPLLAAALSLHHFFTVGDPEEALALVEVGLAAAEEVGDPGSRGLVLRLEALRMGVLESLGRVETLKSVWEAIEHRVHDAADDDAAWCLARASQTFAWDPEFDVAEAATLAREAVRRGQHLGPDARFSTQVALGIALAWSDADPGNAVPILRSAIETARQLDDPRRVRLGLSMLIMATMTVDEREGTDLTAGVEDELLDLWNRSGRPALEEWVVWTAIRRGMWDLADQELDRGQRELRGRRRVQLLMPRAVLRWMQGRLIEAEEDLDEVASLGPIRRWHHDYYPTRAEVAAWRGDRTDAQRWVDRHFEVTMEPAEEIMRIAGLRAVTMAHVDAGDLEAAQTALGSMQAISSNHPVVRTPSVQVGSRDFYLAAAAAEVTRLTQPDPRAWSRAGALATWTFWACYCRIRGLEASVALGGDVSAESAAVRDQLDELGAAGLLRLLDSPRRTTVLPD